ncbi:MAG: hypothetical protein FJ125_04400, partial [Deltaproteobacteria bacterium]|nr:hypothetical protein [Deltaproteobacteria bacterium]
MSSAELASLPFADLTTRIDALLCEGGEEPLPIRVEELLDALAGMPDHEPLGYALRRLAAQGRLEGSRAGFLSGLLAALPDTGLQRVLRGLEPARLSGEARAAVVEAAAAALQRLPLERLAALALLAGWLKRAAPELEAACTQAALQRCRAAVRPEALRDEDLALLPGRALVALAERPGFGTRLETFCERALDILQRAPRSLSQANAEELLSRRVYIEPGHFLFELLQNAADAGARRVSVAIEPDRVLFAHDGQPFDLRDVVGVLSIGQSSKRKEQIGFFGVGFKSVYGICERPQVHSGLFSFEIADVSMPRRLAGPPPEAQVGETLLLLPLRDPADSARNAAAVTRFAGQIPPETLLTMPGLAELRLYSPGRHEIVQRRQEGTAGPVSLLLAAQGECRRYHVAARDESYAGQRESRRAAQSPLLVALRLDEQGLPTPLAAGPTLFAYLPTREAAGLRFLVHAHFDLPVDRERLERGSPFNRWLLGRAGELLAGELCRLLRAQPAGAPRRLWACRLLQLLPLPEELPDPLFHELKLALRDGLAAQPVLPGAAGEWLRPAPSLAPFAPSLAPSLALSSTPSLAPSSTPSSTSLPAATAPAGVGAGDAPLAGALLEPPVLALALAGLPLGPAGRRALAPLPGRAAAVAVSLGVPRLAAAELPQLLGH